jgi:formate C-acetyltransferase
MLAYALANVRLAINAADVFAGVVERHYMVSRRYAPSTSDASGIASQNALSKIASERARAIAHRDFPDDLARNVAAWDDGLFYTCADLSHTSPDWDRILSLGIPGLLTDAERCLAARPSPFAESAVVSCRALRDFALRFARVAAERGRPDLAEILSALAARPPETLHEALQLALLYRHAQEIEGEWVRSLGVFDRQYGPFLERDLAAGRLTEDSAEELLLRFFALLHAESKGRDAGAPICFGGYLPGTEGHDGCNRLTRLAFRAFRVRGTPSPKFSLRVNPDTPPDILRFAAECVQEGKNAIVFANESVARKAFLRRGKAPADLANFLPIGCYEPAIMGKELSCTMTCDFNLAKPAEELFADASFRPSSYDEVETRYFASLAETLREALGIAREWELAWRDINPSPMLSATMSECMAKGLDVSAFGTKYATSGVMCAGLATAVDTLLAIRALVFDKKLVSYGELGGILRANWEGHEDLRQFALRRAPKWGSGDAAADDLGKRICETTADVIESAPSAKEGGFQMGLWSIDWCIFFGDKTGATADGRLAGTPISKNSGASFGCDSEGIAGVIQSLSGVDHSRFPDGAVLDAMFPPATVAGPEGADFIANVVRAFFAKGGFFVHFNVLSPEQLRAAQADPEKYRNLQVRLCGWNVRFVNLDKTHQDWLIREVEGRGA